MDAAIDIQSTEHKSLLDAIDRLRAQGISRHVALPEIVVTGDQSAGKSSVLEAISGISFPTKDNLCTRFATELSLRRSPWTGVKVSIIPGKSCTPTQQKKLQKFAPKIEEGSKIDLGNVIELAKDAMGITSKLKTFSDDILRVEVSGPQQPHLTMVDLPGLFQAGNSAQSDEDSETVADMVLRYMKQPRSIILAVVSAKSDFALQKVTRLAREYDPKGARTLGLITKPDTLDEGSESQSAYVKLAQNEDVQLRLGWHVLKNRDYKMVTTNATSQERDEAETAFFNQGVWSDLDRATVGVAALRARLSNVLKNQIIAQLPSLIKDVEDGIGKCKAKLKKVGSARETLSDQRQYLLQISQKYSELMKGAIGGIYTDPFFGSSKSDEGFERRLRAMVQSLLTQFKDEMHENGCSKRLIDLNDDVDEKMVDLNENEVLRSSYVEETGLRIDRNRGCELPGTFNPLIVGELFTEQCKPWEEISKSLASDLIDAVQGISHAMMHYIAVEETAEKLNSLVSASIHEIGEGMKASFAHLLRPHQDLHPITYNHALTENVHRAQVERRKRKASARIATMFRTEMESGEQLRITPAALVDLLSTETETDMKAYGSALAVDYMEAYYNVSLDKYIDDISALGVECCLIDKLRTVFEPSHIYRMDDTQLQDLAAENPAAAQERAKLMSKMELLQLALRELRNLTKYRSEPKENRAHRKLMSLFVKQRGDSEAL
ncbi:hypothetical protein E4U55_008091 [Claviceps digitariae]|nr:hypothetical protein E4U55_008091 [Claviceps digitariae]